MSTEIEHKVWSGRCDSCGALIAYASDAETEPEYVELMDEWPSSWEGFSDCQVCGGSIGWNGSDPVSALIPRWV